MYEGWNAGLASVPQRPIEKRDNLHASELYRAPIDTWLKMRGEAYTNPPNERSRMKFEAAHLVEWAVSMVLMRSGILQGKEVRCEHQYPGLLMVSGRMDFIAGGKPDYENARAELMGLGLPDGFLLGAERVIQNLQAKYPHGLAEKPIEIKSVSSFAMDSMERKGVSIKSHRVQLKHYMKSTGYPVGLLVYICRDDNRMMEFHVRNDDPKLEAEYHDQIELLTKNQASDTPPAKEEFVVWEEDFGKFSKNLNVEYSPYLTKLYGFEAPREFSEIWGKKAGNFNRVLKRVKDGAKMTALNEEVLQDMRSMGFDPVALAAQMPDAPIEEEVPASE